MNAPVAPPPLAMLAEVTHRCPLACPYCSNPLEMTARNREMTTEQWADIFRQAAALGVLHLHLSGGEPASRSDLEALTRAGSQAGLYVNLITSGVGLTQARLSALADAGLDHLQLSLQGVNPDKADKVGGYKGGFDRKIAVAGWTRDLAVPLTLNAVFHRSNMEDLPRMIELALEFGARRLEVATVQFHGWAERNKDQLMPTRAQVETMTRAVAEARAQLKGDLVIDYVPADYFSTYPKACLGGWGRIGLNVEPDGRVLPCHAAASIPGLAFANVLDTPLADIWYSNQAFNAFRGKDWMREPCRSCERADIDFGGCRCQAMAFTGDARNADPVCVKSPDHGTILAAQIDQPVPPHVGDYVYRGRPA